MINLMHGDCLERMKEIPDGSVDMILTDPPYGTTACKWDSIIPLEPMWEQLKRIIKPNGAIVMTASQPFTSILVTSNIKMFKYEWIWEKAVGSNFASLKYQPMKEHESVLVFAKGSTQYYPIKQPRKGSGSKRLKYGHSGSKTGEANGTQDFKGCTSETYDKNLRNPSSVQYFNNREKCRGLHPTQKPVTLMEYLIKTYTNENETVLDFTMGSGTTGVAAKNLNRSFIGIEMDDQYFDIAKKRIEEA
jgi:site-specific DNA-methyltransferase (adenine-specific)